VMRANHVHASHEYTGPIVLGLYILLLAAGASWAGDDAKTRTPLCTPLYTLICTLICFIMYLSIY
jgi:hypothetical protein